MLGFVIMGFSNMSPLQKVQKVGAAKSVIMMFRYSGVHYNGISLEQFVIMGVYQYESPLCTDSLNHEIWSLQ